MVTAGLSYLDISYLTFQAVLEVVIICTAGFIAARTGLLTVAAQKIISSLNVDLFTPCLVFAKLAPSLSLQKLVDIIVIPIFYVISTFVSYLCSRVTARFLSLNEPESNFVTAMSVFGNSNSLPVSLTLSLAATLPGLEWQDIENDTADKIASRGILYLLIFQQLGQVLRWSWGYNKLLRPIVKPDDEDVRSVSDEEEPLLAEEPSTYNSTGVVAKGSQNFHTQSLASSNFEYPNSSSSSSSSLPSLQVQGQQRAGLRKYYYYFINSTPVQKFLGWMNPPLYAMLISVIVASIPALQNEFFVKNGFVSNTVSSAIKQLGSVSIPLILIVLGSNLSPSQDIPPPSRHYSRIVVGSLVSRMILPPIFLLPLIALSVKYFQISILDDPIFLIVCFILTVSPPAIQLSQICQLNGIYQKEMAGVLFWGYVVLTLPTSIIIVTSSLEVLQWAKPVMGNH